MNFTSLFLLISVFLLVAGGILGYTAAEAQAAGQQQYVSPWRTPWTYEGAGHRSDLDPGYALCNIGKEQSPIDIRNPEKTNLPALQFESTSVPLR